LNHRKEFRDCYASSKRANAIGRNELQNAHVHLKICNQEKKLVQKEDPKSKACLFVADRSLGIGSRIKGHRRYGGK
ncbi:uncharacterized protein B0P05DRAFT_259984, partial [Gilbertella persicaria]|uniref:uncharacterized protein n=1 Tax=Gilbertella persicaria TaxID=101096 RepID=UPI002221240A